MAVNEIFEIQGKIRSSKERRAVLIEIFRQILYDHGDAVYDRILRPTGFVLATEKSVLDKSLHIPAQYFIQDDLAAINETGLSLAASRANEPDVLKNVFNHWRMLL
jgi:hypothetical protein